MSHNTFNAQKTLHSGTKSWKYFDVQAIKTRHNLPFSIKVLLENLLRYEDGKTVTREHIDFLRNWDPQAQPSQEIAYRPARVLMQDFTGVPAVVDLAAMRDAMVQLGGDQSLIEPLMPTDLVIDHSVQVDAFGTHDALRANTHIEFTRNAERYAFLKWGQQTFRSLQVVPPGMGIVHQVNIERLASVMFSTTGDGEGFACPDTVVGTDSHTTMVNGLGVLGWGVGGIEAEAAMLGQPISMLVPRVVGFCLTGALPEGTTATDLVLMVTQMLRNHGVVGKFVEFYGPGVTTLSLADRATIANMAPEYGATCGLFPIDEQTLAYLRTTGRHEEHIAAVEAYFRAQGMFGADIAADYSEHLELDMANVRPSLAGPKRPQDRLELSELSKTFRDSLSLQEGRSKPKSYPLQIQETKQEISDGAVVIAAITSCTNTSNPSVLLGAGLLARNAIAKGLQVPAWVKTSLAPGSRVVQRYLQDADLLQDLESLGFHIVGYGCTTCIGNSGPLLPEVSNAVQQGSLNVAAVLSGNRNFEGRVNPEVKMNFLASPPLVVAYALAGTVDIDITSEALATNSDGEEIYLRDIWPSDVQLAEVMEQINRQQFIESYASVFDGDENWQNIHAKASLTYAWDESSTYVRKPPFFENMQQKRQAVDCIANARIIAFFDDSVTTDHISPAGAIKQDSPAGQYLISQGVKVQDFNSYGARRGNHEVMMRGTFANIRLRNKVAPGTEGGLTRHLPDGKQMSIYDAAMRYINEQTPVVIIAGKEYGTGSSRDWAAKGPLLLGIQAVLAESFERIHRTNLVGVGILPLQFKAGENAQTYGISGEETITISKIANGKSKQVEVTATKADGTSQTFAAIARIDTPQEIEYFQHGGILRYVLHNLAKI